ncbi:NUDIX hydrolase [Mucisphaera sp.]|uniref:NUDIX hydrolase n=1 Tax=Mucisphaera sp. TaxID=2913024 RepID=UPI003D0CF8D0
MARVRREAGRVLVVDPRDRLLLVSCLSPETGETFWITPGGGRDEGESFEAAALRELEEEAGLKDVSLGPWVWSRRAVFPWMGRIYDQTERFFWCRLDRTPEVVAHRWTADEKRSLGAFRWWSVDELVSASDLVFAPRDLGVRFRRLLAGPLPEVAEEVPR